MHGAYYAGDDDGVGYWVPLVWSLEGKRFEGDRNDLDLAVSFSGLNENK